MLNKNLLALRYGKILNNDPIEYSPDLFKAFCQELNNYGYCLKTTSKFLPKDFLECLKKLHPEVRPLFPVFPKIHKIRKKVTTSEKIPLSIISENELFHTIKEIRTKTHEDLEFLGEKDEFYKIILDIFETESLKVKKLPRKIRRDILGRINSLRTFRKNDKILIKKLSTSLHPEDYKTQFPNAYSRLTGKKLYSWEERRQLNSALGVIEEAKFILETNEDEFVSRFRSLMDKAYKEKKESQLSELLVGSELSLRSLLTLLKTYELSNSLCKHRRVLVSSQDEMSEYLRFIIISEILKYKGSLKIKKEEWLKEISVTSILEPENVVSFNKPPQLIKSSEPISLQLWELNSKSPFINYQGTMEIEGIDSESEIIGFIYSPSEGTKITLDETRIILRDRGWYIGFIGGNGKFRWIGDKLRKIYHGEMIKSFIPSRVINIIKDIYTKQPEFSLYDFLE